MSFLSADDVDARAADAAAASDSADCGLIFQPSDQRPRQLSARRLSVSDCAVSEGSARYAWLCGPAASTRPEPAQVG